MLETFGIFHDSRDHYPYIYGFAIHICGDPLYITGVMVYSRYYKKTKVIFIWPGAAHASIRYILILIHAWVAPLQQQISVKFHPDMLTSGKTVPEKLVFDSQQRMVMSMGHACGVWYGILEFNVPLDTI